MQTHPAENEDCLASISIETKGGFIPSSGHSITQMRSQSYAGNQFISALGKMSFLQYMTKLTEMLFNMVCYTGICVV